MSRIMAVAVLVVLALFAGTLYAAEAGPAAGGAAQSYSVNYFTWTVIVAMACLALAAAVCGMAQGKAISSAIESIARQPETASKIQLILMIGLAFIESLVLYVLFISIILLFVNPFSKFFLQ